MERGENQREDGDDAGHQGDAHAEVPARADRHEDADELEEQQPEGATGPQPPSRDGQRDLRCEQEAHECLAPRAVVVPRRHEADLGHCLDADQHDDHGERDWWANRDLLHEDSLAGEDQGPQTALHRDRASGSYRCHVVSTRLSDGIGRVVGGRYRLVAPLGSGSSAQVYLADDVRLGRQVALKMLQPALADDERFLRRFRTEAQTVANISHPNVVVIHDWGEDDVPFLVSEYLAGGSLRAMLRAGRLLTPSQALVVGLDVCRGLAHAHRAGLVHRDLKPANLLFDTDGRLRIADFGLARAIAEAAVTEPEGAVLGTARYAAPEQARGERLTGKADIYALAVLLVEVMTGTAPFASDTTLGTLMARVGGDLEVPPEAGALRPALERAGRLDPDERPDAEELGILLLAASERMSAPEPLPLVGALAEADQDADADGDGTKTMTLLPELDPTAAHTRAVPAPSSEARVETAEQGPSPEEPSPEETTKRRRRWPALLLALLLVALGAGGFFLAQELRTPSYEIPDVLGRQIEDLELIASQHDWVIEEKKTRQDGTALGEIVSTDPPPGESLTEGGTLVVVVSEGNTLTQVPTEIVGRPLAEVVAEFESASLQVTTTEVFDEEIAAGSVVGLDGDIAEELPKQEAVPLLVSKGPAPRTVPELPDGADYEQAAAALEAEQLVPKKAEEFSDDVEKGKVIRLSSEPGSEVPRDSTVTVVVSKGPDVVPVPDLSGMKLDEAEEALVAAGLVLGQDCCNSKGRVVASQPAAGEQVRRGSSVDVFLSR